MGAGSGRTTTAPKACIDALSALVQALRTIQVARGDRPWLLLDLTMAQLKALILLVQSGGLRTRDLADGLGLAPSAVTPLVDRLVDQKLARRENDAQDRRIIWIRPTAKATALHDKLMQTNRSVLEEVLEELPAKERQRVYDSMVLLLDSAHRVLAGARTKGRK
jgi:DNA-binding MarR family transcriptional regulator